MISLTIGCLVGIAVIFVARRSSLRPDTESSEGLPSFERRAHKIRRKLAGRHRHRMRRRRSELGRRSRRIEDLEAKIQRDAVAEEELEALSVAQATLEALQRRHQSLSDRINGRTERLDALRTQLQDALAQQSQSVPEELLDQMEAQVLEQQTNRVEQLVRQGEQRLETQQELDAREIIQRCSERYTESHFAPRLSTSFRCEDPERGAQLVDWSQEIKSLKEMEIAATDREGSYSIKGADPWWKEVVRRMAEDLSNGGKLPTGEELERRLESVSRSMKAQAGRCSEMSIKELAIGAVEGERRRLLDRLRFRTSYRQNQWRHAAEVGFISGMICWELGLDGPVGRRGGILHDIGKALTHDHEGGHAPLGAEVARQEDEHPGVASCIGAHHGDEPPLGLEPFVVAAGDAISGARPGARYHMGEHHEQRLRELDRITKTPRLVQDSYAVHGGREVRVILHTEDKSGRPIRTSADKMQVMAREMADQIEDEMEYPGTINVTLIRRVVAQARAR